MTKDFTIKCSLFIPEGYEAVEIRRATDKDLWIPVSTSKELVRHDADTVSPALILKKTAWKPKVGDTCYRVSVSGEVQKHYDFNSDGHVDEYVWATNQLFSTEEFAMEAGRRIQKLLRDYKREIGEI